MTTHAGDAVPTFGAPWPWPDNRTRVRRDAHPRLPWVVLTPMGGREHRRTNVIVRQKTWGSAYGVALLMFASRPR